MASLGLEGCAVVEDDDELWMTQRVHQRGACVLKVSGVATDLPAVCRAGGSVVGRPALGLFWLSLPPQADAVAAAREPARAARLHAAGRARRSSAPTPGRSPRPARSPLMARVKERFDPARIFRPGTFVGGI